MSSEEWSRDNLVDRAQCPDETAFCHAIRALMAHSPDVYIQLNSIRDWVNAHFPDFELYLEDVWNEKKEGETHIEYILRSKKTLNETDVLGYDIYQNHRDARGVWHLDDYVCSIRLLEDPQILWTFIQADG